jgi:hypothetical protein
MKQTCAHCGKQRDVMKRCSRCAHASYCGAACQHADWKEHKTTCKTFVEVRELFRVARTGSDWGGVLKWEGRIEELVEDQNDDTGRPPPPIPTPLTCALLLCVTCALTWHQAHPRSCQQVATGSFPAS